MIKSAVRIHDELTLPAQLGKITGYRVGADAHKTSVFELDIDFPDMSHLLIVCDDIYHHSTLKPTSESTVEDFTLWVRKYLFNVLFGNPEFVHGGIDLSGAIIGSFVYVMFEKAPFLGRESLGLASLEGERIMLWNDMPLLYGMILGAQKGSEH